MAKLPLSEVFEAVDEHVLVMFVEFMAGWCVEWFLRRQGLFVCGADCSRQGNETDVKDL
jgi:hypothetical protein